MVHFSSDRQDWETPQDFYDRLNNEFGFTLDPCALEETAKCEKFYTPEDDGLSQSWEGEKVFMNPPYGREISDWMKKAHEEGSKANTVVVCLIPSRTDTRWWHDYVMRSYEVRLIRGRLKFGGAENSAPFPSVVVIFRGEGDFTPHFRAIKG